LRFPQLRNEQTRRIRDLPRPIGRITPRTLIRRSRMRTRRLCPKPDGPLSIRTENRHAPRDAANVSLSSYVSVKEQSAPGPAASDWSVTRRSAYLVPPPGPVNVALARLQRFRHRPQAAAASPPLMPILSPSGPALTFTVSPSLSAPSSNIPARRFCSSR